MKKLLQILTLFLFSTSVAFTSVNPMHAMNVFKGQYKFTDKSRGEEILFEILKNGQIKLKGNSTYSFAKTAVN